MPFQPFQPRGWCSRVPAQMWRGRAESRLQMWQERAESRCRCGGVDAHNRAEQDGERPTRLERDCHPLCTRAEQYDDTTSVRDRLQRRECAAPCRAWLAIHALQNATTFRSCSARWARSKRALRRARQRLTSHGCAVGQRPALNADRITTRRSAPGGESEHQRGGRAVRLEAQRGSGSQPRRR